MIVRKENDYETGLLMEKTSRGELVAIISDSGITALAIIFFEGLIFKNVRNTYLKVLRTGLFCLKEF